MRRLTRALATLALAVGCGDDGASGSADAGAPDAIEPGGYPYDDPSDFDRSECSATPPIGDIDPVGILHADVDYGDIGAFPGAVRIDRDDGGELVGLLFGRPVDVIEHAPTDLFLRIETDDGDGQPRVRALLLCAVRPDGGLGGTYVTCRGEECSLARVTAYKLEALDEPTASGITRIAEYNGPAADPWPATELTLNVQHRGQTAYVVRQGDGLRIVDVTTPSAPADLGHAPVEFPDEEFYNDVKIVDAADGKRYAIVASNVRGAVVIDVTDPAAPGEVTRMPAPRVGSVDAINVHTLFVDGTRVYLSNTTDAGIEIYDIADPTQPVRLGGYVDEQIGTFGGFVHDLFVDAGRAYLNYWNLGMVIIDAQATPDTPSVVGRFDAYDRRTSHSSWVTTAADRRIAVHGDEGFGAHVRIVDVDEGSSTFLAEIGSFVTRPWVSVHNVVAVGETALVTHYQDGLRVLDLSDPENPAEIAHYATWPGPLPGYGGFYEGAIGVDYDPQADLVYLADTHRGLFVLRLDR